MEDARAKLLEEATGGPLVFGDIQWNAFPVARVVRASDDHAHSMRRDRRRSCGPPTPVAKQLACFR